MARQIGEIRWEGRIGDIIFYKTGYGYLARTKGSLSKNRIKKDPAFKSTRQLNNEFAKAGAAAKLLRTAFQPLLESIYVGRVIARLTGKFVRVIQGDKINKLGKRTVTKGKLDSLIDFQFNPTSALKDVVRVPCKTEIDKASATGTITIPPIYSRRDITIPDEATHFRWISALASIDFEDGHCHLNLCTGKELSLGDHKQAEMSLLSNIKAEHDGRLILLLGIEFLLEEGGNYSVVRAGKASALAIVDVAE